MAQGKRSGPIPGAGVSNPDIEQLVTARQAAAILGCAYRSIYNWSRAGLIVPVSLNPARYRLGDIIAVREARQDSPGTQLIRRRWDARP